MKIRSWGLENMKKGLSIIICSCLLFSFCFAEDTVEKTVMTLDEAIQYAEENNTNIIDIKRTEKDQKEAYDDAKRAYQKWKNKIRTGGYAFETVEEYLDCWGYNLELATLNYNKFLNTRDATIKGTEYSVKSMVYGIKKLEETVSLLEESIEKQKNDVKIADVKLKLDMITENDLSEIKNTLDNSRVQLEETKNTLLTTRANLKNTMGFDISKELEVILPEYEFNELEIEDVSSIIEDSLKTNGNVISANISYKQKEINNMLAVKTQWFETSDQERDAKKVFSDAKIRLDNEIASIKEKLNLLYESVKTNERSLKTAKEALESAVIKYEQAVTMYELGVISKNNFDASKLAKLKAENTYNSAIYDNILLNNRWEMAILLGDIIAK